MSSSPPPPPSLTSARMSYAAAMVGCVTYGIYVVLAVICIHFLLQRRRKTTSQRIVLVYTFVMLIVSTAYFVCASVWSEVEFVERTSDIGVFDTHLDSTLAILKDTFYVINIWLADSLLVYRLTIIWGGSTLLIIIPLCLWAGAVATGTALLVNTAKPLADLDQDNIIHLQTAFYCLTISLNILCTLLIAGRLWYQQRLVKDVTSTPWSYSAIIAVVIESAALYSLCGIVYVPLVIRKLPLQFPITALIGSLTSIAPNLIILRIALGSAVASDSESREKSSVVFNLTKLRTTQTAQASSAGRFSASSGSSGPATGTGTGTAVSGSPSYGSKIYISNGEGSTWSPLRGKMTVEDCPSAV
ncbi:hypothetical protein C8Q79DRAFT_904402 [Trametes meyenii]|nr:hypothetical protein C8Q79DRAFT_904402 [Trametes meyenii]